MYLIEILSLKWEILNEPIYRTVVNRKTKIKITIDSNISNYLC